MNSYRHLKTAGLRITVPRIRVLDMLKTPECHHISAEELHKKLILLGESFSLGTVYRVLNLFETKQIVIRHNFDGGKSVFELTKKLAHFHIVCLDCDTVTDFYDQEIESRLHKIAKEHGIKLINHSLYLYGNDENGECSETMKKINQSK